MQFSEKYNPKYNDDLNSYSETIPSLFPLNSTPDMSCCYTTSPSWNSFIQYESTIPVDSKNLINLGALHTISYKPNINVALGVSNKNNRNFKFNLTYQYGNTETQVIFNDSATNLCISRPKELKNLVYTINMMVRDENDTIHYLGINDILNPPDNFYYSPSDTLNISCFEYKNGTWVSNEGYLPVIFVNSEKTNGIQTLQSLSNFKMSMSVHKTALTSWGGDAGHYTTGGTPLYQNVNCPYSWIIPETIPDGINILTDTISCKNGFFKITDTTYYRTITYYYNLSFISKLLAGLCLNFIDINPEGTTKTFDDYVIDSNIWTGEMSSDGVGTENWLHNKKEIFSSVNYDTSSENIVFNPYSSGGGGIENDIQNENLLIMWGDASPFSKDYLTTLTDLKHISNEISSETSTVPEGMDVINNVVSIKQYTINLDNYIVSDLENIKIYKWDTQTPARRIKNTKSVSTLCTTTINRTFNDFRDYAPYTVYKLFLPAVGVVELPAVVVDKTLRVNLILDIVSGSAKYNLQVGVNGNFSTFSEYSFNISNDVSFTATNNSIKRLNEKQSMLNIAGSLLTTGVSTISKNPVGIAGGVLSMSKAINQDLATHNSNYSQACGMNGSFTDIIGVSDISLIRITYNTIDNKNYGHTIGYLYNNNDTIKNHYGYCLCTNVDVQVTCTDIEKTMIKNIMESGFYI